MAIDQVKTPPTHNISPTILGLVLLVCAVGASGTVLALPRAIAPRELPGLVLSPAQVARVVDADERAARTAPRDEGARRLQELIEAQALAEVGSGETPDEARARLTRLANAVVAVERAHGQSAVVALRAKSVADFERVLRTRARGEERDRVFGSFPRAVERYDVTKRGRLHAPRFVLRTLWKARWNSVCQLAPTWRFAPVELRAFHGWLALGAESAALMDRAAALSAYAAAGGVRANEARAGLAWRAGDGARAEELYGEVLTQTRSLRIRNHLRAARLATGRPLE